MLRISLTNSGEVEQNSFQRGMLSAVLKSELRGAFGLNPKEIPLKQ